MLAAAFVMGCGKSPSGTAVAEKSIRAPGASVKSVPVIRSAKVMPDPISRNQPVSVEIQTDVEDDDALSFRYQWLVNGHRLDGQTRPMLDSGPLKRGERVSVDVIPSVGNLQGASYRSPEALVGNTPPLVTSVKLEPANAHRGDRLRAVVETTDPDDDVIRYAYRWIRNQKLERETDEAELNTDGYQRGDVIVVEVVPSDAASRGKPLASDPLVLANSPPRITSKPSLAIDPTKYVYMVMAVDADGDFLNYALEQGPPGMTIDKMTGQILWPRPSQSEAPHRVRVVVDDSHEGQAFQDFEISVTRTTAAATP